MLPITRKADPSRDEVTCPFNAAHVIVASRLGNHLIKCAKNYPDLDKAKCSFNSDHILPRLSVADHEMNCPNRQTMERFTHRVGSSVCPVKNAVPMHIEVPSCEEDWDNAPVASPLEVIQEKIVEKPIVRMLAVNGLTKSERKQFKLQEQARLRKLEEEKALKDAKKAQQEAKKAPKKEPIKISTDTPLRLPKTSKLSGETTSSAQKENDVDRLTQQLQLQTFDDDDDSGFDRATYYDNKYVGGYGLPATCEPSNSIGYGNSNAIGYGDECPETYEGRGYDVDYYAGYTGGYGDGQFEDCEAEEEQQQQEMHTSGPAPRWMKVGKGGKKVGKKGGQGHGGESQGRGSEFQGHGGEPKGVQQRLLQLKEEQRLQNLKKQKELRVNVNNNNGESLNAAAIFSPCDSLPSPASGPFSCETDENGFFRIPITGKGRGRKQF